MTNDLKFVDTKIRISTHTLTWSVTPSISFLYALILISTHTLTWSVTGNAGSKPCGNSNFNSHAHVERDWIKPATFPAAFYFNSHAHVERDICLALNNNVSCISTHTLTWSVTGVAR